MAPTRRSTVRAPGGGGGLTPESPLPLDTTRAAQRTTPYRALARTDTPPWGANDSVFDVVSGRSRATYYSTVVGSRSPRIVHCTSCCGSGQFHV